MFDRHRHTAHALHSAGHSAHDARRSYLGRVDPRARIVAAAVLSVAVATAQQVETLVAVLAVTAAATLASISLPAILRRIMPLEILLTMLALLLVLTGQGGPQVAVGPWSVSQEATRMAMMAALKANGIVLGLMAIFVGMDATILGHALAHLHVPRKLAHLLLFTIRYLDVLHGEYRRLRAAMKIRCFRPRMDLHSYRAYGYLVGMLLVRSFDRSERILAAMKCRGFRGRFYLLEHFAFSTRRDLPFCAAASGMLVLVLWLERI